MLELFQSSDRLFQFTCFTVISASSLPYTAFSFLCYLEDWWNDWSSYFWEPCWTCLWNVFMTQGRWQKLAAEGCSPCNRWSLMALHPLCRGCRPRCTLWVSACTAQGFLLQNQWFPLLENGNLISQQFQDWDTVYCNSRSLRRYVVVLAKNLSLNSHRYRALSSSRCFISWHHGLGSCLVRKLCSSWCTSTCL